MESLATARHVTETVYEAILKAVCDGSLRPGERLIQDEVAQRLNVSRLPVHEAMQQLRREGFLVETGRRGLVVAAVDGQFAREVYELRAALDGASAVSAARNARPADRTRGEAIIRAGRDAVANGDLSAMASADFAFHDFVYQLAGNSLISAVAHMNWHHVRRSIMLLAHRPIKLGPFWDEHDNILHAVVSGDAAAAGELARGHAIGSAAVLGVDSAPHADNTV